MAKKPYTKADLDAVSDNPEWTKKDFKGAKPFRDVFPELARTFRGPQNTPKKQSISIRLSPEVVTHYKAFGKGWQTKIDDDLKKMAKRKRA